VSTKVYDQVLREQLAMTLSANSLLQYDNPKSDLETRSAFIKRAVKNKKPKKEELRQYEESMRPRMVRREFFVTEAGLMGIGPAGLKTGDMICQLDNTELYYRVTFLLRLTKETNGKWPIRTVRMIRQCFVRGIIPRDLDMVDLPNA
jgi:hypothetical protein